MQHLWNSLLLCLPNLQALEVNQGFCLPERAGSMAQSDEPYLTLGGLVIGQRCAPTKDSLEAFLLFVSYSVTGFLYVPLSVL